MLGKYRNHSNLLYTNCICLIITIWNNPQNVEVNLLDLVIPVEKFVELIFMFPFLLRVMINWKPSLWLYYKHIKATFPETFMPSFMVAINWCVSPHTACTNWCSSPHTAYILRGMPTGRVPTQWSTRKRFKRVPVSHCSLLIWLI